MATVTPNTEHPAKFSPEILSALRRLVRLEADRIGYRPRLLDPFAGVGRIHQLEDVAETVGVEIEPEWAACHSRTIVGDATALPVEWSRTFDVIATSVVYPNRMTDHHDPSPEDTSKRYGYRYQLGRMPSPGSASTLGWRHNREQYCTLHVAAICEWERVLIAEGLLLLNVSNHMETKRKGEPSTPQPVVEWFVRTLLDRGWWLHGAYPIETRRNGNGSNHELRYAFEMVIAMRAPTDVRLPL